MDLQHATHEQLTEWEADLTAQLESIKSKRLCLDLTRGKPSSEQLSLSDKLDGILAGHYHIDGVDTRNYGGLEGLPGARALGAKMLGIPADQVLAEGNSSLTLMHQTMMIAHHFGLTGKASAWQGQGKIRFICPVPGYDRHYSVCAHLGIEMVTVPMTATGPDMDAVEALIKKDKGIRGMWCVPKYSNPTGVVYDDNTVDRIAALGRIAHADFRVFWDNAYAIHDLDQNPPALKNIWQACAEYGTADSVIHFASTSKITFAGAGVAFVGASKNNLDGFLRSLSFISIGPDKVNQLRHIHFFDKPDSLAAHMRKHADIIQPRFETVLSQLRDAFEGTDLGSWESAQGGYFISFDTRPGLAKTVVAMASDAGVKLTPAGATFPYGNDPEDRNIRIAPTVPSVDDVKQAMAVFVVCVRLASVQQALNS